MGGKRLVPGHLRVEAAADIPDLYLPKCLPEP